MRGFSLEERLMAKFSVDSETGCWNWTASRFCGGLPYGQITFGRKNLYAHRVSYEIHRGVIPHGLCVCHRCDNPGCINPDHLFLGTYADNSADRNAKGRQAKGASITKNRRSMAAEGNGRAKLTQADVIAIRAEKGIGCTKLARKYGVGKSQILRIRRGEGWHSVINRVPETTSQESADGIADRA